MAYGYTKVDLAEIKAEPEVKETKAKSKANAKDKSKLHP